MSTEIELVILQHPSEVKHAKSSVRLLPLMLDKITIAVGETTEDFTNIRQWLEQQSRPIYLLYPSEGSEALHSEAKSNNAILIILDGTWRKALKILKLNPWLLDFPQRHLTLNAPTRYKIRKANRDDSLSSLEAATFGLQSLQPDLNIEPILTIFDAMIEQQLSNMPEDVRKRY